MRITIHGTTTAALVAAGFALTSPQPVRAQAVAATDRGGADQNGVLAEVVITASKRQERLVDVPYSVSAVTGSEITDRGAIDIKDLQYSIPGLQLNSTGASGSDRIQMRGIDAGLGTGLDVVGVYVDDVGINTDQQQRTMTFPLIDIDRVEVLRGPQGTLYGQGAEAGTLRYITKDPSLTRVEGFIDGTLTEQEYGATGYRANGAVSIPVINDQLAVRLVGGYEDQAGWINYPIAGAEHANEIDTTFLRTKILWKPNDVLKATVLYQYIDQDAKANNVSGDNTVRTSNEALLDPSKDISHIINATIDLNLGFGTLTAATGYMRRHYDFDATGGAVGFPVGTWGISFDEQFKQFTEEVRLASSGSGPLRYVIGIWHRNYTSSLHQLGFGAPFLSAADLDGTDPVDSHALAEFGDATWAFSQKLEASAGLRYYTDGRESLVTNPPGIPPAGANFHSLDPRFSVLYKWTHDISTYVTAAKGFRSGGFNNDGSTFNAESLWSYELGSKASLLDGRLYVDGAVYHLIYSNRQSQLDIGGFAVTTNGGSASGSGVEASFDAKLPYELELQAAGSYNNVKYTNSTGSELTGERFNYVPPFTGSLSLNQHFPIGLEGWKGMWRIDYQHANGFYLAVREPTPVGFFTLAQLTTSPENVLNLRVGAESGRMSVAVAAQNLTDNKALVFPNIFDTQGGVRVRPRSVTLNARYNWN